MMKQGMYGLLNAKHQFLFISLSCTLLAQASDDQGLDSAIQQTKLITNHVVMVRLCALRLKRTLLHIFAKLSLHLTTCISLQNYINVIIIQMGGINLMTIDA